MSFRVYSYIFLPHIDQLFDLINGENNSRPWYKKLFKQYLLFMKFIVMYYTGKLHKLHVLNYFCKKIISSRLRSSIFFLRVVQKSIYWVDLPKIVNWLLAAPHGPEHVKKTEIFKMIGSTCSSYISNILFMVNYRVKIAGGGSNHYSRLRHLFSFSFKNNNNVIRTNILSTY